MIFGRWVGAARETLSSGRSAREGPVASENEGGQTDDRAEIEEK